MSTNQTAHEQNLVNLGIVIARIDKFKSDYNPSRTDLNYTSLNQLKIRGETAISTVTLAELDFKNSSSTRTDSLETIDCLITRAIQTLRNSGASEQIIAQGETMVCDIRGLRMTAINRLNDLNLSGNSNAESMHLARYSNTIDCKIRNLNKLIRFLSHIPAYDPIESDLTIASLDNKLTKLKIANQEYGVADAALDGARWSRNVLFYKTDTGIVDIAQSVKSYVKSVFGSNSPQYKGISELVFSRSR